MFILKRITTQGRVCRLAETAPEVAETGDASGAVVDLRALFDTSAQTAKSIPSCAA